MRSTAMVRRLHGHVQLNQRMAAKSDHALLVSCTVLCCCFLTARRPLPRPSVSARWAAWAST